MLDPGTKVMCFPDFEGPPEEFLVVEHDSIRKAYLVQRLGSAPKWEDETRSTYVKSLGQEGCGVKGRILVRVCLWEG